MALDEATIANLELVRNAQEGNRERTLYAVLNRTKTAMGSRRLERNIHHPLHVPGEIEKPLDTVRLCYESADLARDVQERLGRRLRHRGLLARFVIGRSNAARLPGALLIDSGPRRTSPGFWRALSHDLCARVRTAADDVGPSPRSSAPSSTTTGAFPGTGPRRAGPAAAPSSTGCTMLKKDAKGWIVEYQEEEKQRLGIPT